MARKDVNLLVSAAGWIGGFIDKLVRALRERGITDEQIHSLVTDAGDALVGKIADAVAEMLGAGENLFKVVVDYTQSLADMISAGKYDWVNGDIIAENFPISGSGQAELNAELVHFNRIMESGDVLKELDKLGLRPANIAELLAFGAKYPDKQREFPIIALGSVWQNRYGYRYVPELWSGSVRRKLNLHWLGDRWDEDDRFLAFRK